MRIFDIICRKAAFLLLPVSTKVLTNFLSLMVIFLGRSISYCFCVGSFQFSLCSSLSLYPFLDICL